MGNCYGALKVLEHGVKMVDRRLFEVIAVNEMQADFMLERTIDSVFFWEFARSVSYLRKSILYVSCISGECL